MDGRKLVEHGETEERGLQWKAVCFPTPLQCCKDWVRRGGQVNDPRGNLGLCLPNPPETGGGRGHVRGKEWRGAAISTY